MIDGIADLQSKDAEQALAGISDVGELKRRSVRGGAVIMFSQGVGIGLQVLTTVILARILSPADYGLQAMVISLTAFLSLFKDAGLSVASVQREKLTHEQTSTLFWINVAVGTCLMVVVGMAAPVLVHFYREPRLFWITIASATIFFVTSIGIQHRVLLDRAMRFTTQVKIDVSSAIIGTIVAIGMALRGFGYWSLICQNITLAVVQTIAAWVAIRWKPGRPRWTPELKSMTKFGCTVSVNSIVVYIAYNIEKVLLGRFWGPAALGLYGRAYQLSNLPMQQMTNSVSSVAFPMLSRLQNDPIRLRRSYLKAHSLLVSVTVPVVMGCAIFAEEIIRILLGPKWTGAVPILRLLSPAIMVFALMNPLSWLLRATGRVARSLHIALVICPIMILFVAGGIRFGPPGVALGYSVAMLLMMGPLVAWAKHGTGVTTADYFGCIKKPLVAGIVAGALAWLFKSLVKNSFSTIPVAAVGLGLSFVVYAFILVIVMNQKSLYLEVIQELFGRRIASAQQAV